MRDTNNNADINLQPTETNPQLAKTNSPSSKPLGEQCLLGWFLGDRGVVFGIVVGVVFVFVVGLVLEEVVAVYKPSKCLWRPCVRSDISVLSVIIVAMFLLHFPFHHFPL